MTDAPAGTRLPVVIVCGGGHAKVVAEALRAAGRPVQGYVDRQEVPAFSRLHRYLGRDDVLGRGGLEPGRVELAHGIGPRPRDQRMLRGDLHRALLARGFIFATVVHPSAVIAADVAIGQGGQVMAGAVVQPGTRLGADAVVNTRATVDHDCTLAAYVHVGPGAVVCGGVEIGEEAFIGAGAIIIESRRIGAGALVAAGAVVTRDVAPETWVRGVPAQPCGRR